MKRNKIAMLLAMALTVTQSVAVPVAAEELTADASQEVKWLRMMLTQKLQ